MTRDEFITEYCAKSGFSRERFDNGEYVAVRCYCDGNACKGWRTLLNDPVRLADHAASDGVPRTAGDSK